MIVTAIGDTHGDPITLKIAESEINNSDRIIFLGDYLDSFHTTWNTGQKEVLTNIIEFKKLYPDKVSLLFGNHDLSYISDPHVSGHQNVLHNDIKEFLLANIAQFDIVQAIDNWVFAHAGISTNWLTEKMEKYNFESIDDLNLLFHNKVYSIFDHCSMSPTGESSREGPLWIRPGSLSFCMIKGYNQCVGHTELPSNWSTIDRIIPCNNINTLDDTKIILVDSPERNIYAKIDTVTNQFDILRSNF